MGDRGDATTAAAGVRSVAVILVAAAALLAAGCGGSAVGEWEGEATLESEGSSVIDMELELEEGGEDPEGSISMTLDGQVVNFDIASGAVDNDVDLTAYGPSDWQMNLDGEVVEGSTMRGTLYNPDFGDSGEFELTRQ